MTRLLLSFISLAVSLQMYAQPIYRRGGFQFAFEADSILTSDFFYTPVKEAKKLSFALPANLQMLGIKQDTGKIESTQQLSIFPTVGFRSGNWIAEAYLGVTFENNLGNYGMQSSGFGQKPVAMELGRSNRMFVTPGFVVNYRANEHFSFSGGYDKNFIGEGYSSLFLSDNASNSPFFRATTSFWRVKYTVLYNSLDNTNSYQLPNQFKTNKFATTHVIAIKPTKWLEVQLFESIVWQTRDSLNNRGFDLNYFNPVIFFRPVEYSLGSSDNALLGGGFNIRPAKNFTLYSQILLDEFLLKEVKARRGWWANKFALQGGFKWFNAAGVQGLNILSEINIVRPYTYTHQSNNTNYGHNYSALAHPWGANFYQAVLIAQYKKDRNRFVLHIEGGRKGLDTSATQSFGGNVFVPYTYRGKDMDYGNTVAQGNTVNILSASVLYAYSFQERMKLELYISPGIRKIGSVEQFEFKVGIRTPFFNSYANY